MVRSSDVASLCKKSRAKNAPSENRSQHHIPYEHAHPKGDCWACLYIYSSSVSDRGRMPLTVCLLDHNRTRALTKLPVLRVDKGEQVYCTMTRQKDRNGTKTKTRSLLLCHGNRPDRGNFNAASPFLPPSSFFVFLFLYVATPSLSLITSRVCIYDHACL